MEKKLRISVSVSWDKDDKETETRSLVLSRSFTEVGEFLAKTQKEFMEKGYDPDN